MIYRAAVLLLLVAAPALSAPLPLLPPQPVDPGPADLEDIQSRLYVATLKQARHMLTLLHDWDGDPAYRLLTESKSPEHWIRPNTGALAGFCFLHRFGPYDEKTIGVSRGQLLESTILPMIRYLVTTHITGSRPTGDSKPWGDHWQSAHWAHMLGRGAWWVWDALPQDLRDGVCRVLAHEADRFVNVDPTFGEFDDTKAEENAWNSQAPSVAVVLMPDDPRRADWERTFQRWAMSSMLRPADAQSETVIDGRPVREQFSGANIHDDFTLENHGRVHPDYMMTFSLSMNCMLDFIMTGRKPPEAISYNAAGLYENLKWFFLPCGGYLYPNGQDWELFREPGWFDSHVLMATQAGDPDAWVMARPCFDTLERMQARGDSGVVYPDGEFFFASTRTDLLYSCGLSWLFIEYRGRVQDAYTQPLGVRLLEHGKILLNRTPDAVHSVSWGPAIMVQYVPYRLDRLTSPHMRSGVGHIRLRGDKEALPIRLGDVALDQSAGGFHIRLEVIHGENLIKSIWDIESFVDGTMVWHEELRALAAVSTEEVATGLIGVLNNATWVYEEGRRDIAFGGHRRAVVSGSGESFEGSGVRRIDVDGALIVESEQPLDVGYRGAKSMERARYTDELYLNYTRGARTWEAGDQLAEYRVRIHRSY